MKKILFVLLVALCGVSFGFGKPTNPSDSVAEVPAEVPEAANPVVPVDCADCMAPGRQGEDPNIIKMEQCIDDCMNK